LFGSVVLCGVAVFAIPAIMAAAVGGHLGKARAAVALLIIIFWFALGQTSGPVLVGIVAESSGSCTGSYLASTVLTGFAVVFAWYLPKPQDSEGTKG